MGYVTSIMRRFFHPAAIDEMLATFVPQINGTNLNVGCSPVSYPTESDRSNNVVEPQDLLVTQYYMLTFLPQSHPQSYLPMLMRLWESVNSYIYDERMFQFLSRLAETHVDPSVSDPGKLTEIPDDALSEGESRPQWAKDDMRNGGLWTGLYKDVGIFTEYEWHFVMCKCLASMGSYFLPTTTVPKILTWYTRDSVGRLWFVDDWPIRGQSSSF